MPKVYFITAANRPRGLGFTLVSKISALPDTLVFATARNPDAATELNELARERGNIVVVKLEAVSEQDAKAAAALVAEKAGKVDYLVPCVGMQHPAYLHEQPIDQLRETFEINVFGQVILYQALLPLLLKADKPVLMPLSSGAGSSSTVWPIPIGGYGMAKAALTHFAVKVNSEQPHLCTFPIHPGVIKTDFYQSTVDEHPDVAAGMEHVPEDIFITAEQSADGMIKLLHEATRETHGGKFLDYKGDAMPW